MESMLEHSKNPHERTLNFQIRLIQVLNLRLPIKYQGVRFLKGSYSIRYDSILVLHFRQKNTNCGGT